jgi:hypothetical protein
MQINSLYLLNNKYKKMKYFSIFLLMLGMAVMGCKDTIDEPPFNQDPNLATNINIAELKALYNLNADANGLFVIKDDKVILGIVNGDDKTGNWYKEISMQDSSGGIGIKIDQSSLYNDYPIGRRIYIKLKGCCLGMYAGNLQIGGYLDSVTSPGTKQAGYFTADRIASSIVKGSAGNKLIADTVSIGGLNDFHQYRLVCIKNSEFDPLSVGMYFADYTNKQDASRKLFECSGNFMDVRTSAFSSIANLQVPSGNGKVTGVYTIYKSNSGTITKQLKLRDATEMELKPVKCGGDAPLKALSEIKALYSVGNPVTLGEFKIEGIVISDRVNNNIFSKNVVIQNGTTGMVISFPTPHTLDLGDKISIAINGGKLEEYKNLLQISNINSTMVSVLSKNNVVQPRLTNVADLKNNFEAWESTLVKIVNPTLTPGGSATTYSGNVAINDATAAGVTLYTYPAATFSGAPIKGAPLVGVTGIVSQYLSTLQLQMRKVEDVE